MVVDAIQTELQLVAVA